VNPHQILRLFPNASKSLLKVNAHDYGTHDQTDNSGTVAKLEQDSRHGALAEKPIETPATGRVHIRFESVRKRLCDPDNLSEKWTLDCLRYIGVIRGDEPDKITLETTQRRTEKGEAEHTEITITYP
jgi:hypothetical protein